MKEYKAFTFEEYFNLPHRKDVEYYEIGRMYRIHETEKEKSDILNDKEKVRVGWVLECLNIESIYHDKTDDINMKMTMIIVLNPETNGIFWTEYKPHDFFEEGC